MLGKVMKYELRASGRLLIPCFIAALVLSGISRLLFFVMEYLWQPIAIVLNSIASLIGVAVVVGLVLLTFVYMVVRFYQGMVSGEAYLSFTLPVKVGTHLLARLIVGTLYCVAGIVLAVVSALIIVPGLAAFFTSGSIPVSMGSADGGTSFMLALSDIPAGLVWSILGLLGLNLLAGTVYNLLYAQVSIAIAPVFTRHRVIGSVAAYLALSTVESLVLIPTFVPIIDSIGPTNADLAAYLTSGATGDLFAFLGNLMELMWLFVGLTLAVNLIFAVIHFFLARWCLSKRLNLD